MDTKNRVFVVIGSIALVATTAIGGYALFIPKDSAASQTMTSSTSQPQTPATTTPVTTSPTTTTSTTTTSGSYKDGTYTTSSSYSVPHGGQNSLQATIVVANGKITSVKTNDNYTEGESAMWISGFENSVSGDATGQSLADYSPSQIGGASLTTAAFDNVLDTIRTQASA